MKTTSLCSAARAVFRLAFTLTLMSAMWLAPAKVRSEDAPKEIAGWGVPVDPDGDCKITVAGPRLNIELPGKPHALCIERDQMNAPRVLRQMTGDFVAKVKVIGNFPKGAESQIENRRAFHSAGFVLAMDHKNYIRLEKAEMVAGAQNMTFASFELRDNGVGVRWGNAGEHPLEPKQEHVFLQIEREGGKITASISNDDVKWTKLKPINVDWPATIALGLTAGHNSSDGFKAGFELLSVEEKAAPKK